MESLPIDEVIHYLRIRQSALQNALDHIQGHRAEQLARPEVPRLANAIFDHTSIHTQAELNWVKDVLQKIERGEYP